MLYGFSVGLLKQNKSHCYNIFSTPAINICDVAICYRKYSKTSKISTVIQVSGTACNALKTNNIIQIHIHAYRFQQHKYSHTCTLFCQGMSLINAIKLTDIKFKCICHI